ncbi:MAG TPA: HypC/HybG/HupF family hydrogenase formation chaperone [Steroidobacteraceae bacterium]|nr:HypC/HybG/HupF family hydrogenase formation chaperone [Steroidobacteraceae bacterium]
MCLAIPAQIVELLDGDRALVELGGIRKAVSLALVEGARIGDYVIIHVGYALQRLNTVEAERTLDLLERIGAAATASDR